MSKKIAILGCGWLGLPLAKSLLEKNFIVSGSTTSFGKLEMLQNFGINTFLIEITASEIQGAMDAFLDKNDILIIDIPPKLRGSSSENFVQKIENCIPYIEKSTIKKVIFISSTSVYADDNLVVDDYDIPNSRAEAGKQLFAAEKLFQRNTNFETTIIRFGGLVGTDRHPAKMLSGQLNVKNPDAVINLIHQEDCIKIIEKVISYNLWNNSFNAVSPYHPTREKYYPEKTFSLGMPPPTFDHSTQSEGKLIKSNTVTEILKHQFLWVENI